MSSACAAFFLYVLPVLGRDEMIVTAETAPPTMIPAITPFAVRFVAFVISFTSHRIIADANIFCANFPDIYKKSVLFLKKERSVYFV